MYNLVVVDMQQCFFDRFQDYDNEDELYDVMEGVKNAVIQAIEDGADIIDLNYDSSRFDSIEGETVDEIRELWAKYIAKHPDRYKHVWKSQDGGGEQVVEAEPRYDEFRVCGINLGACVLSTVNELLHDYERCVHIVQNAVANAWGGYAEFKMYDEILI